jgi:hypothetical protein
LLALDVFVALDVFDALGVFDELDVFVALAGFVALVAFIEPRAVRDPLDGSAASALAVAPCARLDEEAAPVWPVLA